MGKTNVELNGSGSGSGSGSGYGYGDGDGYGYGSGSGSGYGYGKIQVTKRAAWTAYHYIKRGLILRNQTQTKMGEHLHESKIKMCEYGLHASLSPSDATNYKPVGAILTKVLVWGKIEVGKDKLVATDRQIIEIME